MKTIKIFSLIFIVFGQTFLFNACNQSTQSKESEKNMENNSDLAGLWVVTDDTGNKFDITLNKDGTASSTWSVLDKGTWKVIDRRKAHIKWNNGVNEFIIIDEQGGAERQTFAPGKSTEEGKPSKVTKISKK